MTTGPFALQSDITLPGTSSIVAGRGSVNNDVIVTLPAGMTWIGQATLSACLSNASGAVAEAAAIWMEVAGTGATPAAGTQYGRLELVVAASGVGQAGNQANAFTHVAKMILHAPEENEITLVLKTTGTPDRISACAHGIMY